MPKIISASPQENYKVLLRFDSGEEGLVDLSDIVRQGIFTRLSDPKAFRDLHVTADGTLAWSPDMELCSDMLYMRMTKKPVEELFPKLRRRKEGISMT